MRSLIVIALALTLGSCSGAGATGQSATPVVLDVSDAALLGSLPGFESGYATVNGTRLHYVAGGDGPPIVLLPGWPQTWWAFHKVMPQLAKHYRVIALDLRGMGGLDKPLAGYDKKTMAADTFGLVRQLGYESVHLVGHDIGAQVAFSFAANYPEATATLTLLDVPHPDDELLKWPLLPQHGTFGDKIDERHAYAWWFAFHQVKGLPEDLLEGRASIEQAWFFRYLLYDESAIDARDRAVYGAAYASRDALRAGNAWYQAFTQDIIDDGTYAKLTMPVLGLGGPGYEWLNATLSRKTTNLQMHKVAGSGHFIAEEKPDETVRLLTAFLTDTSRLTQKGHSR